MILRFALRNASRSEWAHHADMARAAGVADRQVEATNRWPSSANDFAQDGRIALEMADTICDGVIPDALVAASLDTFGSEGHVELVVTSAAHVMVPARLNGLRAPLEKGFSRTDDEP